MKAMANKKGGEGTSNAHPLVDAVGSQFQLDLQVYRDETTAQLLSVRDLVTSLQGSLAEV